MRWGRVGRVGLDVTWGVAVRESGTMVVREAVRDGGRRDKDDGAA